MPQDEEERQQALARAKAGSTVYEFLTQVPCEVMRSTYSNYASLETAAWCTRRVVGWRA